MYKSCQTFVYIRTNIQFADYCNARKKQTQHSPTAKGLYRSSSQRATTVLSLYSESCMIFSCFLRGRCSYKIVVVSAEKKPQNFQRLFALRKGRTTNKNEPVFSQSTITNIIEPRWEKSRTTWNFCDEVKRLRQKPRDFTSRGTEQLREVYPHTIVRTFFGPQPDKNALQRHLT